MDYRIDWIEAPWLLRLTVHGTVTAADQDAMLADELRYLNGANGKLYWVCDVSRARIQADGSFMATLTDAPMLRHPNCGMLAFVSTAVMIKFISTITIQKAKGTDIPLHIFESATEAETFCHEVATIANNKATECYPVPASY